jgi:hypothetical protein
MGWISKVGVGSTSIADEPQSPILFTDTEKGNPLLRGFQAEINQVAVRQAAQKLMVSLSLSVEGEDQNMASSSTKPPVLSSQSLAAEARMKQIRSHVVARCCPECQPSQLASIPAWEEKQLRG